MTSIGILKNEMPYLIALCEKFLCITIRGYGTIERFYENNGKMSGIYISYFDTNNCINSIKADISASGEVFNTKSVKKEILTVLYDWLNRIGYDKDRQIERTEHYKKELYERCYSGKPSCCTYKHRS